MAKPKTYYIYAVLLMLHFSTAAQITHIDSLKNSISAAQLPAEKLTRVLIFCDEWTSYSPDTLLKFAILAKQLATAQKNNKAELAAGYYLAAYLFQKNKLDTALKLNTDVYASYKSAFPYDSFYVKFFRLNSNIFLRTANYDTALQTDLDFLKLAESKKDTSGMVAATMGIGNVSNKLNKTEEALKWYYAALDLMQNDVYKRKFCFIYNNIAIAHYKLSNKDSMIFFVRKGLVYSKQSGNLTDYANSLLLYGGMLAEDNQLTLAENAFKEGLEERKKIGDIYYIINDMAQFALFYLNTNQPQKGISLCLEGLELAKKNKLYNVDDLYQSLARNYKAAGEFSKATDILEEFLVYKDSVYSKNSTETLAEMQTKYDVQKKENTIIQQKYDIAQKNYFIYGIVGLLAATLLFGYFFFQNRKKNQQLKIQAIEIEQKKKTTQAVMQAEEDERKRIALELHDSVAQKMVVAKLNLEAFESDLDDLTAEQKKVYNTIFSMIDESCTEVRELSHSMVPQAFFKSGLTDALKSLVDKIKNKNLHVTLSAEGNLDNLEQNTELMIYRIIQECVQNVLKHAKAGRLDIALLAEDNELDITLEDNGTGFNAASKNNEGFGIKNVRSRIEYLNGTIDITSAPGKGTCIAMHIPVKNKNEA